MVLEDAARNVAVFNTHNSLYWYNGLPFGVSTAASIFQQIMESILKGLPNVCVYLDDILVSGESEEDYLRNLGAVLT